MLTDLDAVDCAPELLREWLGHEPSPDYLFWVCVREVEAWLLGHKNGIADLLRIPLSRIPEDPEALPNPKAELIRLAQRSPAKIRNAITPVQTASIGPGYNDLLGTFIRETWSPRF